jgi:hypothetical protein
MRIDWRFRRPLTGLSLLVLAGCQQEIHVRRSPTQPKKLVLNVYKNQVVKWFDGGQQPLRVTFLAAWPCADKQTSECRVLQERGEYRYKCAGCKDPEIIVGSDLLLIRRERDLPDPDAEVGLTCKGGNIVIDDGEGDATTVEVKTGQIIQWFSVGAPEEQPGDWALDFGGNTVCKDPVNYGRPQCTVVASSGKYSYTASTKRQGCNSSTGYVQVE